MEKTLEIQLQEERERISRAIEAQLSFYLRENVSTTRQPEWALGFSQALAFIANRVKDNFGYESIRIRYQDK